MQDSETFRSALKRPYKMHIDRLLPKHETPRIIYRTMFFASLSYYLHGHIVGIFSTVLMQVRIEFTLTVNSQEGIICSLLISSSFFACLSVLMFAYIGRRIVIMLSSVLFMLGLICAAVAADYSILILANIIIGCGLGLSTTVVPTFLREIIKRDDNIRINNLVHSVMFAVGLVVGNILSGVFSKGQNSGWRYLYGLGAIPSALQFMVLLFVPLSPYWLVKSGRDLDARVTLQKLRGEDDIDDELEQIRTICLNTKEQGYIQSWKNVIRNQPVRRAMVVGGLLYISQQVSGIGGILFYNAILVNAAGIKHNDLASWLSAVNGVIYLLSNLLGVILIHKLARRTVLVFSLLGVVVCLALLAIGFLASTNTQPVVFKYKTMSNTSCYQARSCYECVSLDTCGFCNLPSNKLGYTNTSCVLANVHTPWSASYHNVCTNTAASTLWAFDSCTSWYTWLLLSAFILYVLFYAAGIGILPAVMNAEIYPCWAELNCSTFVIVVGSMIQLIVTSSFLSLLRGASIHGTFWIYACLSLLSLILLITILPETKIKSREEIEQIFSQKLGSNQPAIDNSSNTVQYVHIRGLNRDGAELDSPE